MQEDKAADVLPRNDIKGNIVCIYISQSTFMKRSQNVRISFVRIFFLGQTFQNAGF